jgi:hypothetical protein
VSLFKTLSDEFDSPVGQLTGYLNATGTTLASKKHYNLRSFYPNDQAVPRTMPDFRYWNAASFDGTQMVVLDQPRSVTGRSIAARTMDTMDAMADNLESPTTMLDLENYVLASGNEGWPAGDPNVILSQDATNRYANVMTVVVPQGPTKTVTSTYRDNIFTGLNDDGGTYYIELVLPSFPAQGAAAHLDLANSFIDFTSDASGAYSSTFTDSIRFNQSENSLTAGGNVYFRINRNLLTHADLASLQGIRFRLAPLGTGNVTVKFQAMRVFKSGDFDLGGYPSMGIETKRNVLSRLVPQLGAGQNELATGLNMVLWDTTRPKNVYEVFRFNTGHIPTSPSNSTFSFFTRYDPVANSFLRFDFSVNSVQSRLTLSETINGASTTILQTPPTTNTLANSTDYYAVFESDGLQARATLYASKGAFFGAQLYTTDWLSVSRVTRGYSGFSFNAYNYDFQIDWIKNRHAEFATFESLPFKSFTPVTGASFAPKASTPLDLSNQNYLPSGDANVTLDVTIGNPPPSHKIVRSGSSLFGGYQTTDFLFIGDPKFLTLDGDLYPETTAHDFRVVLIDKYDTVAFNATIPDLKANQWNHFSIPVLANIAPANYKVLLQQVGFFPSTFWIQNFEVNHDTIAWYLSPDAGGSWSPVLGDSVGQYNGVNFGRTGADQTQLKVRGIALSDTGWIQGYEVIPRYANPGHFFPGVHSTSITRDLRITGIATTSERTQNVRITGQDFSNTTRDLRIFGATGTFTTTALRATGATTSFDTRAARITGQATSFRTSDLRVAGSLGSSTTLDVRITGQFTTARTVDFRTTGSLGSSTTMDFRITGITAKGQVSWTEVEAPAAPGSVIFVGNFEPADGATNAGVTNTGTTSPGYEQFGAPSGAQYVNAYNVQSQPNPSYPNPTGETPKQGTYNGRCEIRDNGDLLFGNQHAQFQISGSTRSFLSHITPDIEHYVGYSIFVPTNYTEFGSGTGFHWNIPWQWHHGVQADGTDPATTGQAPINTNISSQTNGPGTNWTNNSDLRWQINLTTDSLQGNDYDWYRFGLVNKGVWTNFIWHLYWSPDTAKAITECWIDGVRVLSSTPTGTTLTNLSHGSAGRGVHQNMYLAENGTGYRINYVQFGQYREANITGTSVLKFDAVKVGTTYASVDPG